MNNPKHWFPSNSTMILKDALIVDPNLLDGLTMNSVEQTQKFKDMFISTFNNYDIGGETLNKFKLYINDTFKSYLPYYQELIDDYEQKIEYLDGYISNVVTSNIGNSGNSYDFIDLPNKVTTKEYVKSKTKYQGNSTNEETINRKGGINILYQKRDYQAYLRNIYYEFVEKFNVCFVSIYE